MSTPDDTTTLMTKVLLPRRRDDILTRQRLLNALYDMVDYRLALVSAPAGMARPRSSWTLRPIWNTPCAGTPSMPVTATHACSPERLVASIQHRFRVRCRDLARARRQHRQQVARQAWYVCLSMRSSYCSPMVCSGSG